MANTHREKEALNSVRKATNAVGQAGDHPSDRMIEQADNALIHANVAVGQALDTGERSEALSSAVAELREGESKLNGSSSF
jgi:hypothetical protein